MGSMRLFLLLAFNALMLLEAHGFTDKTDTQALLEFKSQVSEDKRVFLSSWNHSFPLCSWEGVKCGRKHKRVTSLDLRGMQLGGVISPSIGNLSFLIYLDLSNNSFGGTIPQEVGDLFRLEYLYMGINYLGGGIPTTLSNCSRLLDLDLFSNPLGRGVPSELGSLANLVSLNFRENNLQGKLPASLGNLTSLIRASFGGNNMEGEIPDDVARLSQMMILELSFNQFSGVFPPAIYNMSSLENLYMAFNHFSGRLRPGFGILLPNLQELNMGGNFFTGSIPTTLSNISTLQKVGLNDNNLTGSIPTFEKVPNLQWLLLRRNSLGSYSFGDLDFISSLTNCTQLEKLGLGGNRLGGDFPISITNLSAELTDLLLEYNHISGRIPQDIGNLLGLQTLGLRENMLSGPLPTSLGNLFGLGVLDLSSNKLSGVIPSTIGNLTRLQKLRLSNNIFEGTIPPSLSNCSELLHLEIGYNKLNGTIPKEIMQLSHLLTLSMPSNSISGTLPNDVGRLQNLVLLSVSDNKLSGELSQTLGNCLSMEEIYLQGNSFDGIIPNIKGLVGVKRDDMSNNNLSGISLRWLRKRKKNQKTNNSAASTLEIFHEKISYGDLRNATDGFSASNMVGSGSFGTVFKALLPEENKIVAVKVLNMERRGAMKSFMAECESLKDIRHRNLVKLLTACASIDFQGNEFRALIYEFMPNGSLDMWLHPEEIEEIRRPSRTLTLRERLNIAVDVASVLDYLHVHCHEPIAHCDLKPSNVLLDDDLTAHVSDFGLARLLLKFDQESFFNQLSSAGVRGTIGYAAPEYGMGGQPSIHGDVYSFGVLVLEMFTGKRPTNELFEGSFTLHSYTRSALPERVLDIADKSILHSGLRVGFPVVECLKVILDVGLRCCEESPMNRLATSEAAKELISIRERFFKTRRTARR
ncbi:hypothetical protein ARALYDRAFT_347815 [Arabidopsis lyrata subsp. lyrata]|uniref:non-specific serine/threonine protein kinase n=1 Tax=Arabidopsis lyrata subsp. lyrata TaxID=81972 RepID=D7LNA5_ARALL|nr:hypothetical protein ARALYDRAFT_347815 [Arabidopsis lyrata subsp. lyrata]